MYFTKHYRDRKQFFKQGSVFFKTLHRPNSIFLTGECILWNIKEIEYNFSSRVVYFMEQMNKISIFTGANYLNPSSLSSTIDGNVEFVQQCGCILKCQKFYVSDKIINDGDSDNDRR